MACLFRNFILRSAPLLLLAICLLSPAQADRQFNYLYIDASEGNSSGGHTAVQFGDEVYHYQFVEPGIISLEKQSAIDFEFAYRFLGNRTIHVSPVNVTGPVFTRLRDTFNYRYLVQKQQFAQLDSLNRNRILLEYLSDKNRQRTAITGLRIDGAGLFYRESELTEIHLADFLDHNEVNSLANATIRQLRTKIEQKWGDEYLARRKHELVQAIKALQPENVAMGNPDQVRLSQDSMPAKPFSLAERYADLMAGLLALDMLESGRAPLPDAYFVPEQHAFRLNQAEIETLKKFRADLAKGLLQLTTSTRPDWGYALLANTARLVTVDLSIAGKSLVFVDVFRDNAELISPAVMQDFDDQMSRHHALALDSFMQVKALLADGRNFNEFKYSRLELLGNRYHEFDKGIRENTAIRFNGEDLVPTRSIAVPGFVLPELSGQVIAATLNRVNAYEKEFKSAMQALYSYDLITRNCVTELFQTLEQALPNESGPPGKQQQHPVRQASLQHLGGVVETVPVNFIPFTSFNAVQKHYDTGQPRALLSYRLLNMQAYYHRENDLAVFLRESNTFSSTLYRRNPDDSFFVFFTDDQVWLRPLLGIFNVLAATGQTLTGLVSAPFDSGHRLKTGSTGIVMSLPELAFFNMRKGSYKYLSFDWQMNAETKMDAL